MGFIKSPFFWVYFLLVFGVAFSPVTTVKAILAFFLTALLADRGAFKARA